MNRLLLEFVGVGIVKAIRERPAKLDVINTEVPFPSLIGTRYSTPRMVKIWGWNTYIDFLLRVEAASSTAIASLSEIITLEQARKIRSVANVKTVTPEAVAAREAITHHDIGALQKELAEQAGDAGAVVHFTLTSADVTETAKAMQLQRGLAVLIESAEKARDALLTFAEENADATGIMRTHGQQAIPASYGHPFAVFAYALQMSIDRLEYDLEHFTLGKISGAIGTYDTATDEGMQGQVIEKKTLEQLNLKPSMISMQVPPRETLAFIMSDLSVLAARIGTVGEYIKELKRTEIGEIKETPDKGTIGSSAMGHKDKLGNPHIEERLESAARIMRGAALVELESVAMEDFRDLSASMSDRITLAQAFILVDYSLALLENVVLRIEIVPENIEANLNRLKGIVTSPRVMSRLVSKGMPRPDARKLTNEVGRKASELGIDFATALKHHAPHEIGDLLRVDEIDELTDPHTYIGLSRRLVDQIIDKYKGNRKHVENRLNIDIPEA